MLLLLGFLAISNELDSSLSTLLCMTVLQDVGTSYHFPICLEVLE